MASTNKTPQLGLNQWAAGDEVLRADFNADNGKIEAAVAALQLHKAVAGTYLPACPSDVPFAVNLGFRPQAVIVSMHGSFNPNQGAIAVWGQAVTSSGKTVLWLTDTGFEVCSRSLNGHSLFPALADPSPYFFVAFA